MMQIEIFRDAGWETSQMGHKKNSKLFVFDEKKEQNAYIHESQQSQFSTCCVSKIA